MACAFSLNHACRLVRDEKEEGGRLQLAAAAAEGLAKVLIKAACAPDGHGGMEAGEQLQVPHSCPRLPPRLMALTCWTRSTCTIGVVPRIGA